MRAAATNTGCAGTTSTTDSDSSKYGIRMMSTSARGPSGDCTFLASSALLFIVSAGGTIYFCASMSGGMVMPGGWTMSMTWMRMPEQTWAGAAASFMAIWTLMMLAMMLPSFVPMLLSYRSCVRATSENRLGALTTICGAAYFFVWAVFGAVAYALGLVLASAEMHWSSFARSVPVLAGFVFLLAGCIQLTAWKARQLRRCRLAPVRVGALPERAHNAWQHGVRFGVRCALCCFGFMIILLVAGAMNLAAMAILGAAITIERIAPRPAIAARAAGAVAILFGVIVIARGMGVG
jgi:predicted metal-binding membrane protein